MEHLAERLAQIPGVVAVTLGGSRARGRARDDSDWNFGRSLAQLSTHDVVTGSGYQQ